MQFCQCKLFLWTLLMHKLNFVTQCSDFVHISFKITVITVCNYKSFAAFLHSWWQSGMGCHHHSTSCFECWGDCWWMVHLEWSSWGWHGGSCQHCYVSYSEWCKSFCFHFWYVLRLLSCPYSFEIIFNLRFSTQEEKLHCHLL